MASLSVAEDLKSSIPKKMSLDVAADFASSESLSFAGLVCIQDQKERTKVQREEPEFEFSCSNAGSTIGSPNNNFSADKSILNGQLATTICSSQHQVPKQIPLEDFLSQIPGHRRESDIKQLNLKSSSGKQISQVKRRTKEKRTTGQKSFGQKLFSSFATPCRDCRALQPTPSTNQHTL